MFNSASSIAGTVLIASGAIGAGMFALPIVSAGMWTVWAMVIVTVVWAMNLLATTMLAKINLRYAPGASFDTIVRHELGPRWNMANNVAIWFVMAILLYAYFSASSSIVAHTFSQLNIVLPLTASNSGLLFGGLVALLVWTGSHWVSKVCGLLLLAMIVSFSFSTGGLLLQVDTTTLLHQPTHAGSYIWASLPYFVTAFACAGLVPSLVKHYQGQTQPVLRSLIYGTLISLTVYALWLAANFGNINRDQFVVVIEAGGNMGQLAEALQQSVAKLNLLLMLTIFSNLAVTTSFISIGLGLFDFVTDRFKLSNSPTDRFKAAAICFIPPALLSYAFPKGFVLAIGYAGIAVLFSFYLIPALMTLKSQPTHHQTLASTTTAVVAVVFFALVVLTCKIFTMLGLLATFASQ